VARARTNGHVRVRHLRKTDYGTVSQIYSETIREYLASLKKAGKDRELESERVSMTLTLPSREFEFYSEVRSSFVALSREKVVGFILTQPVRWMNLDDWILWLEYIAVTPAFRNQGVGSALLSSVRGWGARQGIGRMFTTLNPNNEASGALLRSAGFEVREWRTAGYPSSRLVRTRIRGGTHDSENHQ
jgi:GNAT superfamily N-acetyltransferase